jgi:hypothetical protein
VGSPKFSLGNDEVWVQIGETRTAFFDLEQNPTFTWCENRRAGE